MDLSSECCSTSGVILNAFYVCLHFAQYQSPVYHSKLQAGALPLPINKHIAKS